MSKLIQTAPCRFCGQMVQIEDQEEEYTKEQAEEAAVQLRRSTGIQEKQEQKEKSNKECAAVVWRGCRAGKEMQRRCCRDPKGSSRRNPRRRACKNHSEREGGSKGEHIAK